MNATPVNDRIHRQFAALLSLVIILTASCSSVPSRSANSSYAYTTPDEWSRNPLEAQRLTMQAADLIESDPARAEELLRKALAADIYHGPAHNNLGVLYLEQDRLYEAANEFEWARKLMPGHPDPRLNLGLTLETAGRIDEALATYESALEAYPNHLPTVEALARLQIRHARLDDQTASLLEEIALRANTRNWREWATLQLQHLD